MNFLGLMYGEGWGIPEDYHKAVSWFQKAAKAGHPLATYNLAIAYDNGLGVSKSPCQAFQLYMHLAQQDYAAAMQPVGNMYEKGIGTEKNSIKARYWYRKGARLGHPAAMYDLGRCYMRGIGGAQNLVSAKRWLEAASAAGEPMALLAMGTYFTLLSIPDWEQAFLWYEQAIEEGTQEVCAMTLYKLGKLALKDILTPEHPTQAQEYFQWAAKFGHQGAALQLALLAGESF